MENVLNKSQKAYISFCIPAGGPNWNIEGETIKLIRVFVWLHFTPCGAQ